MKCILSQTDFCGAVNLHGNPNNRLLADLDYNGWPQTGCRKALTEVRKAWAPNICISAATNICRSSCNMGLKNRGWPLWFYEPCDREHDLRALVASRG